jgi:hypothetical protein
MGTDCKPMGTDLQLIRVVPQKGQRIWIFALIFVAFALTFWVKWSTRNFKRPTHLQLDDFES